jgi:hypothetical protein
VAEYGLKIMLMEKDLHLRLVCPYYQENKDNTIIQVT